MIAELAIENEQWSKPGWVVSTATTSGDEPLQRQKYGITDTLVVSAELADRPPATHNSLASEWRAFLNAWQLDFADLVSQYVVTTTPTAPSPSDDPELVARWSALLHRVGAFRRVWPAEERDLLDWDVAITTPPARPSKTVYASVRYHGRAKPRPIDDPWD